MGKGVYNRQREVLKDFMMGGWRRRDEGGLVSSPPHNAAGESSGVADVSANKYSEWRLDIARHMLMILIRSRLVIDPG